MTKRESCFFAFLAGSQMIKQISEMQYKNLGKELEGMEEELKGMSGDDINKMLEDEEKKG